MLSLLLLKLYMLQLIVASMYILAHKYWFGVMPVALLKAHWSQAIFFFIFFFALPIIPTFKDILVCRDHAWLMLHCVTAFTCFCTFCAILTSLLLIIV